MKILYCNKYNFRFSGTEAYLFDLMELMCSRGHEAALFSMADPRGEPTPHDRHFVPHVDFKRGGLFRRARLAAHGLYSLDARRRLGRMIAEFRPDIAHVRNIYHHLSPSVLWELKRQKVPVIYHLNDFKLLCPTYNMVAHGEACERCAGGAFHHVLTSGCHNGPSGARVFLAAEAYLHHWLRTYESCVDCFLAPSEFVKRRLIENGWDSRRIEVLSHFQRLPHHAPSTPDGSALYFGRLSPEKGVVDLLRAMQLVPEVRLRIAGDGPQRQELEALTQRLSLANVEFLGHVAPRELNRLIAAASFTVFPSRAYETFGKSILESYAWQRPVIASDLGSRREAVEAGITGLLFPVGDVHRLADAISHLARNPQLAAAMGIAGHERVRKQHSPESHYAALLDLYSRLAPRRPVKFPAMPRKARVAFIGGRGVMAKYSGIETCYEETGKRLAAMGHEVTVYCRTHFTPPAAWHEGMRLVRLPTIRSKHLETVIHTLLSTAHAMAGSCDVVHYHALGPALFSFFPRLAGKKTVVTVQGLDWQRRKWGRIASAVLRLGELASQHLPNATVVVSQTLQKSYRKHFASYIPNGTSIRSWHEPHNLNRWGLEPGNYILYLGRFSPEKNCHLLVQACERLATSAPLVLAGGSSHTDSYVEELRRHQSDKIRLLDWVSGAELDELLTNAMLFVLPSDLEGLSLALLDAMGAGVCTLVSDIPENREVVSGAGFTFKRGDAADLSRMLGLILAHPEVRQAVAHWAQERVRQRYLWPQIAEQLSETYQKLMKPELTTDKVLTAKRPHRERRVA